MGEQLTNDQFTQRLNNDYMLISESDQMSRERQGEQIRQARLRQRHQTNKIQKPQDFDDDLSETRDEDVHQ